MGAVVVLSVDKSSFIPIYHQIKEAIRGQIDSGVLNSGDRVPSLNELSQTYGISLMTAHQALKELVVDGVVEVRKGKGAFVVGPRIEERISRISSFTQDMRRRGLVPSTKVLLLEVVPCMPHIAMMLELHDNEPINKIRRLRLADGEPMTIQTVFLPVALFPDILEKDLTNRSLTEILELEYGMLLRSAWQKINADLATNDEAHFLNIPKKSPVLRIDRVTYTEQRKPVEYLLSAYRSDKYDFIVELLRDN